MKTEDDLDKRVKSYLCNGGLFNPEHMDHDKVRQLIIDLQSDREVQKEKK